MVPALQVGEGRALVKTEYLREFVVLAHYGNFHVAAEKLFISQSALSSHVKALEHELGHSLFDRENGNALTSAGALLLEAAQSVLATVDGLMEECRALDALEGKGHRSVRVAVFVPPPRVHAILEAGSPCPCDYVGYDMSKPALYSFAQDNVDVMCTYDLDYLPTLRAEAESLGLKHAPFGFDYCAIAMKESNPLAQGPLTRERLRGASVVFTSAVDYAYWKAALSDMLGADLGLKVRLHALFTLESLRSFDLEDAIMFSFSSMVEEFFSWRDGYTARYTVDGEPLRMRESVVWRPCPENPDIERVALLLSGGSAD